MLVPEKLDVDARGFLKKDDLSEFEASPGINSCRIQDLERLDEIIGRYLPIAQSAEQDFDRALRASYIVLELIDMESTLLDSYNAGKP
jgi:hypothetical protein